MENKELDTPVSAIEMAQLTTVVNSTGPTLGNIMERMCHEIAKNREATKTYEAFYEHVETLVDNIGLSIDGKEIVTSERVMKAWTDVCNMIDKIHSSQKR